MTTSSLFAHSAWQHADENTERVWVSAGQYILNLVTAVSNARAYSGLTARQLADIGVDEDAFLPAIESADLRRAPVSFPY